MLWLGTVSINELTCSRCDSSPGVLAWALLLVLPSTWLKASHRQGRNLPCLFFPTTYHNPWHKAGRQPRVTEGRKSLLSATENRECSSQMEPNLPGESTPPGYHSPRPELLLLAIWENSQINTGWLCTSRCQCKISLKECLRGNVSTSHGIVRKAWFSGASLNLPLAPSANPDKPRCSRLLPLPPEWQLCSINMKVFSS